MKIDLCLVASDLNTDYIDFFPLVLKAWKDIVGIDIKLILISDFLPENLIEYKNNIILFKPIENIPTAFQAQCIRILYPCILNKNIILSDMDLIPLNRTYYTDNIEKYKEDSFIVYRNVLEDIKQYPICFCIANSKIWKEIFNINTEEDIRETLKLWYFQVPENDYTISSSNSFGWAFDQIQLFYSINIWNKNIIKLDDSLTSFKRLDRILNDYDTEYKIRYQKDANYIINNKEQIKQNINNGVYSDFHLPKPFIKYKDIIEYLLDINYLNIKEFSCTEEDIISTDKYLNFCRSNNIQYIKTDYFKTGKQFLWRNELHPTLINSKVLVSGHSDFEIDENIFIKYNLNYVKWFSINVNYIHEKLFPLPLGITNNTNESEMHSILGNTRIMIDVLKNNNKKEHLLYMNFNLNTHCERPYIYFKFKEYEWCYEGIVNNTLEGRKNFLEDISKSKFVLCPRGNGIDTHRLWEALYMKSIPIVKYHIVHSNLTDLPILFINDWSEINKKFLENKYEEIINKKWNLNKLKISYWLNYINII